MAEDESFKEKRIRNSTHLYYSRPEVQKAIYEFSKSREIAPRYFEGFGKRPDTFEYPRDVYELVKRGATSFHCSEELWENPLKIETGMSERALSELRIGWDLLIDIDCKWFDYSKLAARAIITVLKSYRIKKVGLKFSGNKGFHILVPWKAFPKELAGEPTKNLFPELPRKIVSFLRFKAEEEMKNSLPEDFYKQFENVSVKKGIKCNNCKSVAETFVLRNYLCRKCHRRELKKSSIEEVDSKSVLKCPDCRIPFELVDSREFYFCSNCNISSKENSRNFSRNIEVDLFDLMGLDLILVSPRHLFRMPYSLHEKTSLASVVIPEDKLEKFEMKDADISKIEIKNFMPDVSEGEASEFVREALDWTKDNQVKKGIVEEKLTGKYADAKPINIKDLKDEQLPPSIKKILNGVSDGRKRALFVLINFFRSLGIEKDDFEKRIFEWNGKNEVPLKEGYIKTQIVWAYGKKPVFPPNFSTDYYKGIGVNPTQEELKLKNPVSYVVAKNSQSKEKNSGKKTKNQNK